MARLRTALIAMVLCVLLAPPATADYGQFLDPEGDVDGRLDISDLIYSHRNAEGRQRFAHLVATHGRWKARMLDGEHRVIHLFFDTKQDAGYEDYSFVTERRIEIFFKRGRLRAKMYNNLGDPPKFISNVMVRRGASDQVYVVVPRRRLKRGKLPYYEWAFMTVYSRSGDEDCPLGDPCVDKIGKYIRHDL